MKPHALKEAGRGVPEAFEVPLFMLDLQDPFTESKTVTRLFKLFDPLGVTPRLQPSSCPLDEGLRRESWHADECDRREGGGDSDRAI